MRQRRKYTRWEVNLPILCKIRNRNNEIIISSVGKVKNICLGGMKVHLPVRLMMLKCRLIEYTLDLPEPFPQIAGKGIIRWGYWDESAWETNFGMEVCALDDEQLFNLENMLIELAGDRHSLFMTTLAN